MSPGPLGSKDDERRASLTKVTFCSIIRKPCSMVLGNSPHTFWLPRVRQLRGFDSVSRFDSGKYGPIFQGQVLAPGGREHP